MSRWYEFFVALRYLRSRGSDRFISMISGVSIAGIAIAVATLIVVLSVMNGFRHEVRTRILNVVSHAGVTALDGRMGDWPRLLELAAEDERIRSGAPFVEGQALITAGERILGLQLRGIDPEAEKQVSALEEVFGDTSVSSLDQTPWSIVLGRELASELQVVPGDSVVVLVPQGIVTPAGVMPRMRRFTVAGTFYAGMYEYDRGLAYLGFDDAARLLGLGRAASGVTIAMHEPMEAPQIVRNLALRFGGNVYVTDWTRQHANFFRSIELTKTMIFLVLLLVVAVAAFNIVSTLAMVVRDKQREIAVIRTLGSSPASVLSVFVIQGMLIGTVGLVGGIALGFLIADNLGAIAGWLESILEIQFLSPDVYFISEVTTRVEPGDLAVISLVTLTLAVLAAVAPAINGSRTDPAGALRYE